MKKLFNFRKNLLKPLAFLLAFSSAGYSAKAQIMYTDINPDLNGTELEQAVSGTTFTFGKWGIPGGGAFTTDPYGIGSPVMVAPTGASPDKIAIVDQGAMIGPNSQWNVDAYFTPLANGGTAVNVTDKYLGFRIGTAGNYKYGWFKINVNYTGNGATPWVIKSYAYQNTANTAIAAGDMGNGTGNVAVTGVTVNGQGGASAITANDGTLQMVATVTPANATNAAVTWSVQNGTGTATISATGLLTAQTNGTVTVKATSQDGSNKSGTKVITISGQTVGIAAVNLLASSYYPNPVHEQLNLQFAQQETISGIRIYNIAGQVVYQEAYVRKGMLISIPTTLLPEGTYILTFENAMGKQGLQKFVKQ